MALTVELDRVVSAARADSREDDPVPAAREALTRSRALGWRAVLGAHEVAWKERWDASDVIIEGDTETQEALRHQRLILRRSSVVAVAIYRQSSVGRGSRSDDTIMLQL